MSLVPQRRPEPIKVGAADPHDVLDDLPREVPLLRQALCGLREVVQRVDTRASKLRAVLPKQPRVREDCPSHHQGQIQKLGMETGRILSRWSPRLHPDGAASLSASRMADLTSPGSPRFIVAITNSVVSLVPQRLPEPVQVGAHVITVCVRVRGRSPTVPHALRQEVRR